MVDRHYDDEALISFLESSATASDPHLLACGDCRETLDTLRSISCAMADEAVWQPPVDATPNPRTIATLRAFADNMTREDAEAEALLPVLIADARLAALPEYQTAGVVRRLLAAADRAIDTMPRDAVALTALATSVADALDASRYESDAVAKLRGASWRDYAYALYYTGSFADAERAVLTAESHFSDCVVGEYEAARVGVVQTLVYRAQGRIGDAIDVARTVGAVASRFEDAGRVSTARSLEASLFFSRGEYRRALDAWSTLLDRAATHSADTFARLAGNVATCYRELGDFAMAVEHYRLAAAAWDEIENGPESSRVYYNIALTLLAAGDRRAAVNQLSEARRRFETFGMLSEAALCALYSAEAALLDQRHADAAALCHSAMSEFERSGLVYTERALTAIAYIKEAAEQQRATPQQVREVREYVKRLPREPQLLFAAPPA